MSGKDHESTVQIGKDAMGWLSRLFGGKGDADTHDPPSMPWDRRPSILEHVRSHVTTDGLGLAEGGETLPGEERIGQGSKIRWAAGATFVGWPRGAWPDGLERSLEQTYGCEPNEGVRERMQKALQGEPPSS